MNFLKSCCAVLLVNCLLDFVTLYQTHGFNKWILHHFYIYFDSDFVFLINQLKLFEKYILTFIFLIVMKVF